MIKLLAPTARTVTAPCLKMIQAYTATVRRESTESWTLTATMAADELGMIDPQADQAILVADTPEGPQPFRIRYVERDGAILTVKAPHVYFDADGVLIRQFVANDLTIKGAISRLELNRPTNFAPWPWDYPIIRDPSLDSVTATHSLTLGNVTLTGRDETVGIIAGLDL